MRDGSSRFLSLFYILWEALEGFVIAFFGWVCGPPWTVFRLGFFVFLWLVWLVFVIHVNGVIRSENLISVGSSDKWLWDVRFVLSSLFLWLNFILTVSSSLGKS